MSGSSTRHDAATLSITFRPLRTMKNLPHSILGSVGVLANQLLDDTLAALFPSSCVHCEVALEETPLPSDRQVRRWRALWDGTLRRTLMHGLRVPLRLLCPACATQLLPAVPAVSPIASTQLQSIAAFEPSPVLFRLIHAFKYEGCRELGPTLGSSLARVARMQGCQRQAGVLVPIPLHADRLKTRGFNQSQLLAQALSRSLRMPLMEDLLERRRNTPALAQIDEAERWEQVAGAFVLRRRLPPPPVRVWLVDDVVTTGATVRAAEDAVSGQRGFAGVFSLCRAH